MPKIHRHTLIVYIEKVIISCYLCSTPETQASFKKTQTTLKKTQTTLKKNSSVVEKSINRADSESVESFGML